MKIKMRHNKKRNTAFIYEALISELTKCSLSKNEKKSKPLRKSNVGGNKRVKVLKAAAVK